MPAEAKLNERRSFDVVVVGGGVIGRACAWRLAQRSARVAVLDESAGRLGATRVAAGMLAPVGELAFGEPELLKMTLAAAELYPGFVAELEAASGRETGYVECGALHIALDRDEAADLRRVHELQRSLGLAAEWLPLRRCRELEPGLTPSFNGGVHAPGEAAVDPRALAAALARAGRVAGVEVHAEALVEEALWEGERIVGVRTSLEKELRAPTVVLAAGAWSGQAPWLPEHARPPVRPVKGQIIELRSRSGAAPCRRILASERVYLVPRSDGRLIVGATVEEQGFDTAPTAGGVHELLREAYRLLPEVAEMELVEAAAGLRPGTPDNLPRVGPAPVDGLIWATGHYRNGILLAPLAATAVADLITAPTDPLSSPLFAPCANKGELSPGEVSR
ncbi:MAG TPA: glycine oxidase ThiO [Solirubrobacterales bacterium]|jgi:glycine oxidase|nr:glycine oxidase ThiO [Solirubrobacterales bacterium]